MSRILFFVFLAFLFWLVIRLLAAQRNRRQAKADRPEAPAARTVETMNQCAWCGAHVPAPDALTVADGRVYCSAAHRDAALTAPESPKDS